MDEIKEKNNKIKKSSSYEITYKYNEKQLANVSKNLNEKFEEKIKKNNQILKSLYEENVNLTCEKKANHKNKECVIQKVFLSEDGKQVLTIDIPTIKSKSEIRFDVKDGAVWRNF